VICPKCGSNRPWGSLLYLKQNPRKRTRSPLPNGKTLESIWQEYGDRCVVCSAPKSFLIKLGIGRQVHHVAPYALEGHRGPLIPICSPCHSVATERQRLYWFFQRVTLGISADNGANTVTAAAAEPLAHDTGDSLTQDKATIRVVAVASPKALFLPLPINDPYEQHRQT
jgi:hypothetical protein